MSHWLDFHIHCSNIYIFSICLMIGFDGCSYPCFEIHDIHVNLTVAGIFMLLSAGRFSITKSFQLIILPISTTVVSAFNHSSKSQINARKFRWMIVQAVSNHCKTRMTYTTTINRTGYWFYCDSPRRVLVFLLAVPDRMKIYAQE